ncbi:MAG: DNA translocase FtsK, partial [Clostridia bacterium]|nr:DNA translocase FtsK [Clostridia bacterium]
LDPEELFEVEESDASPVEEKLSRNRAARSFKPDRSESVEKALGKNESRSSEETSIPVVKANKKNNVKIEDLVIEPDEYEQPDDDDEAPFDIPEPVPAKKKDFPKLKRTPAPEPVEDAPPEYNYPPIDLLAEGESEDTAQHRQADMEKAQLLEDTLKSFGISSRLIGIAHGPAVTRFELQPAPGVKVSRITSLADDIALNLAAMTVRIEAPIPGKAAVGVEIPNDKIEMVRLRDVLESQDARRHASRIAVGLGKDNSGRYIVADIAKMPHVLIAGQTGSGKSVCINSIITSILFRASPEEVRLILIDPKVVELSIYNDIPHLVCPVVTDPKKAASALDWAVAEMSARYKKFAERGVRNIKGYNKALKPGEPIMPQMVIIIDELADLMMVSPGEVEDSICRLAQLARAAGMHLVIATQRPSVNVITGIIKANIPTRIAFSVASQVDSRTMIDHGGAEKLLGNGDMLFVPAGTSKPMRVQGAWVSDEEVNAIVDYIKESSETTYDQDMLEHMENAVRTDAEREEFAEEYDPKLPEAVDIVIEAGQASISMLQRRMRVGYARAGRLIDEMAQRGIISEADGAKPRTVLISREEAAMMFED